MLEDKDYGGLSTVVQFVAASIDSATSMQQSCPILQFHFMYFEFVLGMKRCPKERENREVNLVGQTRHMDRFLM